MRKKYNKKDFLDYATAFNYDLDYFTDKKGNILSDNNIKNNMKSWSLKNFQDWFGFIYKEI